MSRLLVTGASGLLGHNLCPALGTRHEVVAAYLTHEPAARPGVIPARMDITDSRQVDELLCAARPDAVVHAAALSRPNECEQNPDEARRVIVSGTRNVAAACALYGSRLFYISSDLVFDGTKGNYTEEDAVRGVSVYAECKIQAESIARQSAATAVVLRISVLYGVGSPSNPGFLGDILQSWRTGRPMVLYTDQFRTPTYGPEVARVIDALFALPGSGGTYHVGGAERLSRYAFGCLVADIAGAPRGLVRAGRMPRAAGSAARGADCSLVSEKLRLRTGIGPMRCRDGLDILARQGHLAL